MEQIALTVPIEFIASPVRLTWQEVRFGITQGILSPRAAITVATELVSSGIESQRLLDLASLTGDEPVLELVVGLAESEPHQEGSATGRLWAFLLLAWIFKHRSQFWDPLDLVERVYADLDYPEQIADLVRYMPTESAYTGDGQQNEARFRDWEQ